SGNQTIRKLAPAGTNYVVTTIAGLAGIGGAANGAGAAPRFNFPAGIAVSSGGTIYVADSANNTLRLAAPGSGGAPVIVGQPLGQTVDPGGTATFSVMAAGSPSLSYQWRFNGVNLPGATGSTYIKVNAQALDAGNYSVVVTNSNGAATSADAALAVTAPPYIIIPPADQSAQLGQSVTFYVLAGGTQPLSYQWRFLGQDIPGARGPELHIGALVGTNAGEYSVLVANSAGSALSGTATLSIEPLSTYGDNSFSQLEAPGSLLTQPIAVAAGAWHDLALTAAGKVIAWGANSSGQCDVPESLTNALAIAAGGYHSMAIRADRTVIAWGNNDYGQAAVPARLTNVLAVACGSWHSLALLGNGNVIAWGDNSEGQTNVPAGLSNVVAIAAGGNHSLALKRNGTVVGWGENIGENGTFTGQSIPPAGLTNVIRIAAGEFHSLAVTASGSAVAWGDDSEGQCAVPPGLTNIVAVAGGGGHSLALDAQGNVHAWGADFNGQCDIPSELTDLVGISAGEANSLVLAATRLPDPRLFTPELNKAGFSLVIQTLNRKSYALEYATALRAPAWTAISTNSGNGALEQLTDPNPSGPARFYRLRQW
ncbi:MAG TPA: immunoglobulin domain-containing protein, partial [Verrucomicrobiae bacterium]|nr:immunoglobulin domain-containing protein [Verrucomicrobiae bacterium]